MTYQSNSISFFIILGVASHTKKTYNNCKKRDMRESIQYEEKKNRYDFCLYAHFFDNERWYQKRFVVGLSLTHSLEYITLGDQY